MQGIEKIIEKIISDAKTDAKATEQQTQVQIDVIKKRHDDEANSQIAEIKKEAEQKSMQYKQRSQTMADLEKRRNSLAIKRELVEEAFVEAAQKLKQMDGNYYVEFVEKVIVSLEEIEGEIIVGEKDKYINQAIIDNAIKMLSQKGINSKITLSKQKANFDGGFILKNGRIETNCTFDMLVSTAKRDLEQEVASILFAESK